MLVEGAVLDWTVVGRRYVHALSILAMALSATGFTGRVANAQGAEAAAARWELATQDTQVVIGIKGDLPALLSLRAPGSSWNWINEPSPESLPRSVVIEGKERRLAWKFAGADYDDANKQLALIFRSEFPALEMKSLWKAPRGRGPVEHWLTLNNRSSSRLTIGSQASLRLAPLEAPMDRYIESTQVRRGGANALTQGGIVTHTVSNSWQTVVISRPSDSGFNTYDEADTPSQVPFLNLQVESAHGLYVGWKFSALGEIRAKAGANKLSLSVGLPENFVTDLFPGETFLVPAAFVGTYVGGQPEGSYSLHRYVIDSLLPRRGTAPYPTLAYNYYLDGGEPGTQTEADVLASARLAYELGFETFVADAMWFPETGDWRWDPKRFPRGAKPLATYLHDHGMKFGLWMAWTQGSQSNDPGRPSYDRHPDWFATKPTYRAGSPINWDSQIDVGNDEARAWVERETERAVREFELDYLKTDWSPIAITSVAQRTRGQHQTDVSYWSTLGYYSVQEALLRKFPGLSLEGCSSGGRIKDFGNIAHVHYVVSTDTLSALADRQSIYDSSLMFPPSTLQLYTYERYYSLVADAPEPYLWRSAMMGAWQIDLTNSAKLTPKQKSQIKRSTDIYKSWIRPVLSDAKVHRILSRPDGTHWDGLFYWNDAIKRGTAYVFRPNSDRSSQLVYLAGLSPQLEYRVRGEDGAIAEATLSGRALMENGILVNLSDKFTSEIIYVETLQ